MTLEGEHVCLEPLSLAHHAALCDVGLDDDIWRWMTALVRTPDDMRRYIETALDWQAAGTALPFATVDLGSGRVIGTTRFANIEREHRRGEIGWTWLGREWQRTAANTEAKLLMLEHAFETLGWLRVEFKTDVLNARSRAALARIGAREEGTLRRHMITDTGRVRDSVYFSIINEEWPAVRDALRDRLARG